MLCRAVLITRVTRCRARGCAYRVAMLYSVQYSHYPHAYIMCVRAIVRNDNAWRVVCLGVRMWIRTHNRIIHIITIIIRSRRCRCMSVSRRRIHRLSIISRVTLHRNISFSIAIVISGIVSRTLNVTDNACPL